MQRALKRGPFFLERALRKEGPFFWSEPSARRAPVFLGSGRSKSSNAPRMPANFPALRRRTKHAGLGRRRLACARADRRRFAERERAARARSKRCATRPCPRLQFELEPSFRAASALVRAKT